MRRKRIEESPRLTLLQGGDGEGESGSAFTTYGPLRADSTISQRTIRDRQLSESLSSLEKKTSDLESRFYEVCVTLNIVMGVLVERKLIGINTEIIDRE